MFKHKRQKYYTSILDFITGFVLFSYVVLSVYLIAGVIYLETRELLFIYGLGAISLIIQLNIMKIQKFGPAYAIILYTIFTQFGFAVVYLISNSDILVSQLNLNRHLYINYLPQVFAYSFIGCYSFFIGFKISKFFNKNQKATLNRIESTDIGSFQKKIRRNYLIVSTITVYIFAIALVIVTIKEGLLFIGYTNVKEVFSDKSILAYLQKLFWVASVPIAVLGNKKIFKINVIPIGLILTVLLLTGNRNDVLIPLAVGFSLYCLVQKKVPKIFLFMGFVVLFIINPAIAATRKTGLLSFTDLSWGFSEAIGEMGAQVNPFSVMIYLVENGLDSLNGLSLVLPTLAIFNLNIYYSTTDYLSSLYHIPNLLAIRNHLGQAFSMIGEIWLNFGVVGIVLIYFIYGYYSSKIERLDLSKSKLIFYGQFSILMMYWVRNSLVFNVIIIVFSILLYLLVWFLSKLRKI